MDVGAGIRFQALKASRKADCSLIGELPVSLLSAHFLLKETEGE